MLLTFRLHLGATAAESLQKETFTLKVPVAEGSRLSCKRPDADADASGVKPAPPLQPNATPPRERRDSP